MVGLGRFELPTSPLSGVRSSQLSYRPGQSPEAVTCGLRARLPRRRTGKALELSRRVSRTQLNVRDSYAISDHRLLMRAIKRRLSSDSRHRSGEVPGLAPTQLSLPAIAGRRPLTRTFSLRKEVIQPQVLLRLPCYDFTPIMNYTLGGCSLAVSAPTSSATHFRDVTGGVYKARERIHRGMLIRDY